MVVGRVVDGVRRVPRMALPVGWGGDGDCPRLGVVNITSQ